jgi:hypothetical protein
MALRTFGPSGPRRPAAARFAEDSRNSVRGASRPRGEAGTAFANPIPNSREATPAVDGRSCRPVSARGELWEENAMLNRMLSLAAVAALVLFVGAAYAADKDAKPDDNTHTGTFVSFSDGKLVMTDKDGKEHSHTLTKDVKVIIDSKDAKMDDLKTVTKGATLTVTTDKDAVVKVEAKSK